MPTITISASNLPARQRRRIALRLTRWLAAEGANPAHVVVRFAELDPGSVFVGGMPAEALDRDSLGPSHASVTCRVSPQRDADFRSRLSTEIARALPHGDEMPFLYLEFQPIAPAQVWVGAHGMLRRADDAVAPITVHRPEETT